jgi:hypothetical protein
MNGWTTARPCPAVGCIGLRRRSNGGGRWTRVWRSFSISVTRSRVQLWRGASFRLEVYGSFPMSWPGCGRGRGCFRVGGVDINTRGETGARMNQVLADAGLLARLTPASVCSVRSRGWTSLGKLSGSPGTAPLCQRPAACSWVSTQRSGRWRPRLAFGYRPIRCTRCTWSRASSSPSPTPEWRGIVTCPTSKPLAMV